MFLLVNSMPSIKHYLVIKASLEKIYKSLTTKEGVSNWWTAETVVGDEVGEKNEFNFGSKYHNVMFIKDLKQNERVEWFCEIGDKEWIGTKIIFEIEEKPNGTALRFTHKEWEEETDFFASCNYQWGHYLQSLKQYCETGKGTPFQDQ
jgi:uncharacterized protein YndB with AHSA1/START domain